MKKFVSLLFMFILFLMAVFKVSAQSFSEGQNSLSAGYGFDVWYGPALNSQYSPSAVETHYTGPIYFKYEKAMGNKIGLGLNVAYGKYYFDYNYSYSGSSSSNTYHGQDIYTTYSVLFRFNYHFGNFAKVDPYWGLGTGYRYGRLVYNENGPSAGRIYNVVNALFPLGFETTIGIRTYLGQKIALYVEVGTAKSTVQFGVTYKL